MKHNPAKLLEFSLVFIVVLFAIVTFLVKPVACIGFDVMCDLWQR